MTAIDGAAKPTRRSLRPLAPGYKLAIAAALLATTLIPLYGFLFPGWNNSFHVPIVLGWIGDPAFAKDFAIQSLTRYAAPIYPFLSLFATQSNVAQIFLAGLFLTWALNLYAIMRVAEACGLTGWQRLVLCAIAIGISRTAHEASPVGKDGLLIRSFTHTELAQAVALLGIAWLMRGRLSAAALASGIAFDLNALVGVWQCGPFALFCLAHIARPGSWRARLRPVIIAAAILALSAAPVALWILWQQRGAVVDFNYRSYLWDYFPKHFIPTAARASSIAVLTLQIAAGALALPLLPRPKAAALALGGFVAVFGVGVIIGGLTHSRTLLNLHLLRADGMIVWIAMALVAAAAIAALTRARPAAMLAGAAALAGVVAGSWGWLITLVALLVLLRLQARAAGIMSRSRIRQLAPVAFAGAMMTGHALPGPPPQTMPGGAPPISQLIGDDPPHRELLDAASWARHNTPADAMFLPPYMLEGFRTEAHRPLWVNWKEGAVVMWDPKLYPLWKGRSVSVLKLHTVADAVSYACDHGIDYIILDKRPHLNLAGPLPWPPVYDNRWLSILATHCQRHTISGHTISVHTASAALTPPHAPKRP